MSGPQTPGPAETPPAAGPGPRVPASARGAAAEAGDPGQQNQTYPWGRIQLSDDGSLDEIVVENAGVHLEQMDDGAWFLGIDRPGLTVTVWLSSPRPGQLEDDDEPAIPITAHWEIGEAP